MRPSHDQEHIGSAKFGHGSGFATEPGDLGLIYRPWVEDVVKHDGARLHENFLRPDDPTKETRGPYDVVLHRYRSHGCGYC